jgi:hypothetical protein
MIRRCLILGWMVAGLQIISVAQSSPSDPSTQNPASDDAGARTAPVAPLSGIAGMETEGDTEEDTGSDLPQIPALLGGKGSSTAPLSELKRSNYLRGGLNVGATYNDNPLLGSSGVTSNTGVSIFPNISIEQTTSRVGYTLGYAGGITLNQNLGIGNQQAQNLNLDSQFRLSPHVDLRIAENFSYSTGFFDAGTGSPSGGTNPNLITPLSTQRSDTSTVEMNYHVRLNDLIGASGSYYESHFSNQPAESQPLSDNQTLSASAFWLHRLFHGDWAGIAYHFDRITFSPGGGDTVVHSFYAVNTLDLSSRFFLTGFVGPQYSDSQGLAPLTAQPLQSTGWSAAGGVDGGWKNLRTGITAGYSRTIGGGGGVLGTVTVQNVHGNFRRELGWGWATTLTGTYATNQSIIVPSAGSATSVNLTSAGITLDRSVRKSFGLRLGYTHAFQEQFGLPSPAPTLGAHQNSFFVTLSYQWAKPLGL